MKKYVFYKGLNECGFTVCQEFIDQKTLFFLKALVSHFFLTMWNLLVLGGLHTVVGVTCFKNVSMFQRVS